MKRSTTFLIGGAVLLLASCRPAAYEISGDGVIVRLRPKGDTGVRTVRVQVIADDIFRVTATPAETFAERESLSVVRGPAGAGSWQAREDGDGLEIATRSTRARLSLSTGEIAFFDSLGREILREDAGGRSYTGITVDGTQGYTIRQVFDSPKDEALYGLGQHQSEEINYKGKNEELFQYNTKVSVPFVVSTGNYGLLWDNYSLTRFGDPRAFSPISVFKLYDADGREGGLTATYCENADPGRVFAKRRETEIDYENLETVKDFPAGFPFFGSLVTWDGTIEAPEAGTFRFGLYYAGYVKIWIDGRLLADRWRTAWNPNLAKFDVAMKRGGRHSLRIEWKPDGGVSYIGLRVRTPVDPAEQDKLSFWSEMGDEIDYYFIRGDNMDGVVGGYRTLTGKAQVMPKWALGFWQSRERFKTQEELLSTLKEFRRRCIPLDAIVQDWFYWRENDWGSHEFDPARFPDPKAMVDEVHSLGARLMLSVWPKFYVTTRHYKEMEAIGAIYPQAVADGIRDWVGPGYVGSFYDAFDPRARALFWDQMVEHLGGLGIDAWWMDASEPDILSNASIGYRKRLMDPTALGPATKFFNAYALVNARGIYEGSRAAFPDRRVFLLTRSGFAGLQRYAAATWSGDIATRWEDLRAQIPAGINYSLAGNPYWTMDIGGFSVENRYVEAKEGSPAMEEWRELNVRWTQFGAFAPLFRSHGQHPPREVFHLAPETHPAYGAIVAYDRLRYRLMPYIYSLAGRVWLRDDTIMRGLAMDFAEDRNVRDIADQYMFGPSLLVCPVTAYKAREREVYLPVSAGWYDLATGAFFTGGRKIVAAAPYEAMPVFVKAGSIVPFGPEIDYTAQRPADPIALFIYTGADAAFSLYEDEGTDYGYERGAYSLIPISYRESTGELTIGERMGRFPGMLEDRTFNVVWVSPERPVGQASKAVPGAALRYTGRSVIVALR
ncbi:MAG: alpha-xylosidase [Candidatus Aminicenantes bacterium]|nr:alpha-xylosidase [Candidatus Aminicenantes bacterium]